MDLRLLAALALSSAASTALAAPARTKPLSLIPAETFTLANGLTVVLHRDASDPVVAVVLAAHVGSSRETPGRTGFAHLFEHLFFLDSENLGPGGLDRLSTRVGGSGANGWTSTDLTLYLQTVPSDALEKMVWAEADKLGYFIRTVTPAVLEKEKEVVKNEKRERVDNQPYGHVEEVLARASYPEGHPYHTTTIGSMADLDAATLADVQAFHARWYVPDNATLVIAGDFDPEQARAWARRYFDDLPRGAPTPRPTRRPAPLRASTYVQHEDGFAALPQLTLAWPALASDDPDLVALQVLGDVLADGPEAPLYATIVRDRRLAGDVTFVVDEGQLAGRVIMVVTAFEGVDLDAVHAAVRAGLARFERGGAPAAAVARAKAVREAAQLASLGSVEAKAQRLARDHALFRRVGLVDEELRRLRALTPADVERVYRRVFRGKPFVAASFVPKGQAALAIEGSRVAHVVEEPIVADREAPIAPTKDPPAARAKTPSSFDRSVEPPAGPAPTVRAPEVWQAALPGGTPVFGIVDAELPLVSFEVALAGGRLRDDPARPGRATLFAELLTRGTRARTRAAFDDALKALGAELAVAAEDERFVLRGRTLARNTKATMALVREALAAPRFDADELALAREEQLAALEAAGAEPEHIAERVMARLLWGVAHPLAQDPRGTREALAGFTTADLAALHAAAVGPALASVRMVGPLSADEATRALAGFTDGWPSGAPAPTSSAPRAPAERSVAFVDVPGAKQSILLFAGPAPARAERAFAETAAAHYLLGGGGFASRLMQVLREEKGYTYGIRSALAAGRAGSVFSIQSPVRANVTLEAAVLVRDLARDYAATFTGADLALTTSALAKARARSFETQSAKLALLAARADYGLAPDAVTREAEALSALTVEAVRSIAARTFDPRQLHVVIVGDAATQADRLGALDLGPVRRLARP